MAKMTGKIVASNRRTTECPICWRRTAIGYNLWHGGKIIGRMVACLSCTNFDWYLFWPYRNEAYNECLNDLAARLMKGEGNEVNRSGADLSFGVTM